MFGLVGVFPVYDPYAVDLNHWVLVPPEWLFVVSGSISLIEAPPQPHERFPIDLDFDDLGSGPLHVPDRINP